HRRQNLIADSEADLAEQAVRAYFLDEAAEAIASAERHNQAARCPPPSSTRRRGMRREEPIDFGFREPVVAAGGFRRPDLSLVDPLLQRGIADAHPLSGGAHGQERHVWRNLRIDSNHTANGERGRRSVSDQRAAARGRMNPYDCSRRTVS